MHPRILQRASRTALLSLFFLLPAAAQQDVRTEVDAVFADVARPGSPGCALGVYQDAKILYAKGYGLASIELNAPITPQSVFDIGSTSKQFTVASILLLERRGQLSIHDDIRKFIPEVPAYGPKITLLHLMNHTSGLRDYLTLFQLAGINTDSVTTDQDALGVISRQKALNFAPGSDYLYSNSGFFLLSLVVKRVSGKTLREFAAENIFQPLGMMHTAYREDHTALVPNRALAYDPAGKEGYKLDVSYFEQTGDGAVHTSVEDLLKWDENFYTAQIGGQEFLAEIQTQAVLNSGKTLPYAKGLVIGVYRGLRTVSHAGSWGGYRAQLLRFPDRHFSVACLCNLATANPDKRALQVAEVYLRGLMKAAEKEPQEEAKEPLKPEITLSAQELDAYAGDYASAELGVLYRLAVVQNKARLQEILDLAGIPRTAPLPGAALRAVAPGEFEMNAEAPLAFHFSRSAAGAVTGFTLDAGRTKGMTFLRNDR